MRKQIIGNTPTTPPAPQPGRLDIGQLATVMVSSEDEGHPIENAFDGQGGPGGSRWMASQTGEQQIILAFDHPQSIGRILLEVEERQSDRTQEVLLEASNDGGQHYQALLRQEYNFSPPGTTFEKEDWRVEIRDATHLSLRINPDKAGSACRASLTTLVLCQG